MTSALTLTKYGKDWIEDDARMAAAMWARQVGKTFNSTLKIVDHVAKVESGGGRTRWVVLSRGERQAKEAMDEGVKRHLQAYGIAAKELSGSFESQSKSLEVELPNGSRITALPANPDTARGFSANVFLDEFAFHQDSKKIWRALYPVISRPDLMIRVVSTPNGKSNKFYELMTAGGKEKELREHGRAFAKPWSLHFCDIYRAVREGLDRNIDELREGINDSDAWAQEFELQWLDDASAWLAFDLIAGCEDMAAADPSMYQGGPCFVGVDIATVKDLFVIWVLEDVGGVLWTREVIAEQRINFAAQDALLDDVMTRYKVMGVCMDKTGMGYKPVEDAQRRYGSRVHGIHFTNSIKQHLATQGKKAFEDRRLRIPGTQAVRYDLHKLKRITGATGLARFVADSDANGHADRAWALFMAIEAQATMKHEPFEFTPIPARRGGTDPNDDRGLATKEWWGGRGGY